jgi:SNF2 family DNA or RNA helicase
MVIQQLLRLHQVVCGHIKTDDGVEHDLPNNRLEALLEVIDELNGKIIIWATYRRDVVRIVQELTSRFGSTSVVSYYGDTDTADRRSAVASFSDPNSGVRFFVANPATGRYGLTLTESPNCIYYSNSYDLEHRTQSEDRIHRIGQTAAKCTYVDLVVRKSVDEKILRTLRDKKKIGAEIKGDEIVSWIAEDL